MLLAAQAHSSAPQKPENVDNGILRVCVCHASSPHATEFSCLETVLLKTFQIDTQGT